MVAAKHVALLGRALDEAGTQAVLDWCTGLPDADGVGGLATALAGRR